MKQKLVLAVIIIGLLGILGVLFNKTLPIDVERHNRVLKHVSEIKEHDAALNQDVFKVRSGLVKHYDSIAITTLLLKRLSRALGPLIEQTYRHPDAPIDNAVHALQESLREKRRHIEKIKLHHALIRNSLDYFPLLAQRSRDAIKTGEVVDDIDEATQSVLFYALTKGHDELTDARNKLSVLMEHARELSPLIRKQINTLHAHGLQIVNGVGAIQQLLSIENISLAQEHIDALDNAVTHYYERTTKKSEQSRQLIFLLAVLLLISFVYVFILFSRNALALFRERARAGVTLASIGDGVIVTDANGIVEYLNPVAKRLIGWNNEEVKGKAVETVFQIIDTERRNNVESCVRRCLETGEACSSNQHIAMVARNGQEIEIEHSAAPMKDPKGKLLGTVMVFHNVTQTRRMARKLEWQATHDALTGLVNRREFERRLAEALTTARQDQQSHALMYLDLDQFKVVNDTCGHHAGDELLKQLVAVLKNELRSSDTLGRLGGDEFGLLLTYCSPEIAGRVANQLLAAVQQFNFSWDRKTFSVGVSIGLTTITKDSEAVSTIMSAADVACYAAKDGGRNRIHIYEPRDEELARRKGEMQWVSKIDEALRLNRFVLYGQPVVSLREPKTEPLLYEMLIRMKNEDGNHTPPGAFLPAAERYNLMPAIDRWVVANAFHFLGEQLDEKHKNTVLSINLSGVSMGDENLLQFILDQQKRWNVASGSICFEITETAAITNLSNAVRLITHLRGKGFRFALDDFGAGMSSFSYLKELTVDYLKIDGNLVKGITIDQLSCAMIEMIHHLGGVAGIEVIAESVEDEAIAAKLTEIGVDNGQGFWLQSPVPLEELSVFKRTMQSEANGLPVDAYM